MTAQEGGVPCGGSRQGKERRQKRQVERCGRQVIGDGGGVIDRGSGESGKQDADGNGIGNTGERRSISPRVHSGR